MPKIAISADESTCLVFKRSMLASFQCIWENFLVASSSNTNHRLVFLVGIQCIRIAGWIAKTESTASSPCFFAPVFNNCTVLTVLNGGVCVSKCGLTRKRLLYYGVHLLVSHSACTFGVVVAYFVGSYSHFSRSCWRRLVISCAFRRFFDGV